jgi:hypothetical protein
MYQQVKKGVQFDESESEVVEESEEEVIVKKNRISQDEA